jgi:hypothetical protein
VQSWWQASLLRRVQGRAASWERPYPREKWYDAANHLDHGHRLVDSLIVLIIFHESYPVRHLPTVNIIYFIGEQMGQAGNKQICCCDDNKGGDFSTGRAVKINRRGPEYYQKRDPLN